jgi:hypothetical protein
MTLLAWYQQVIIKFFFIDFFYLISFIVFLAEMSLMQKGVSSTFGGLPGQFNYPTTPLFAYSYTPADPEPAPLPDPDPAPQPDPEPAPLPDPEPEVIPDPPPVLQPRPGGGIEKRNHVT